jgi:phosphatidylethanolamine-binding protein (PEBP) family uncharacterized protein
MLEDTFSEEDFEATEERLDSLKSSPRPSDCGGLNNIKPKEDTSNKPKRTKIVYNKDLPTQGFFHWVDSDKHP